MSSKQGSLRVSEKIVREPWEVMLNQLKSYKEEHGHCKVPAHRDKLGRWVTKQRTQHRLNKLTAGQEEQLNLLGFEWQLQSQAKPRNKRSSAEADRAFRSMMQRVVDYVAKEGHGWIPQKYNGDPVLGAWANNRRREKRQGALSNERVEALENAGFVWEFPGRTIVVGAGSAVDTDNDKNGNFQDKESNGRDTDDGWTGRRVENISPTKPQYG